MSLRARHPVPPSSSLPPLRDASSLTASQISATLANLQKLYCPLPKAVDFQIHAKHDPLTVDSGYASEDDEEAVESTEALRADQLERNYATRWLTGFIGRAEELALDEETCQRFVDDACSVLEFLSRSEEAEEAKDDDLGITRGFEFCVRGDQSNSIRVELYDTPMQSGDDHTDVGLQTWGASIVLSDILCSAPESFGIEATKIGVDSRIIELGAGTGLVSLVLSSLLPRLMVPAASLVATDYHPTVLANLEYNIAAHAAAQAPITSLRACHLDWSAPSLDPPLDRPAQMLIAADAVYALEHAEWLHGCAARLLAPEGVFWLMVSVRPNGKFASVSDTVESVFTKNTRGDAVGGPRLTILDMQWVKYRRGVGRADEIGYKLFKIGWT